MGTLLPLPPLAAAGCWMLNHEVPHSAAEVQNQAPEAQHSATEAQHSAPEVPNRAPCCRCLPLAAAGCWMLNHQVPHSAAEVQNQAPEAQHSAPEVQHSAPEAPNRAPEAPNRAPCCRCLRWLLRAAGC